MVTTARKKATPKIGAGAPLLEYFRAQRKLERGATMESVALKIGTTKTTIYRICHGRRNPSQKLARKIELATGVPATSFTFHRTPPACPHCGKELR